MRFEVRDLDLLSVDVSLEFNFHCFELVLEVILGSSAVLLEFLEDADDGLALSQGVFELADLVFDLISPDLLVHVGVQFALSVILLSKLKLSDGFTEVLLGCGGKEFDILDGVSEINGVNFEVLSQLVDCRPGLWEHLVDFGGEISAVSEVLCDLRGVDCLLSGLLTPLNVTLELFGAVSKSW